MVYIRQGEDFRFNKYNSQDSDKVDVWSSIQYDPNIEMYNGNKNNKSKHKKRSKNKNKEKFNHIIFYKKLLIIIEPII